jgi:hypothetical protein
MRKGRLALALIAGPPLLASAPAARAMSVTALYEARLVIALANLRVDQVVTPSGFKAGARLTTIGALGVIKPSSVLAQADGGVADGAPAPAVYIQTQKSKRRVIHYASTGGVRSLADPLTQILRAALQSGGGSPCLGTVPIYDGRQRYDLTLSPAGPGALTGQAAHFGLVHPLDCRVGFHPISGFSNGPPKKNPFLRSDPIATFGYEPRGGVWLLTDVAAPTLVGTGHIVLTSVHIDGTRPIFAIVSRMAVRAQTAGSRPKRSLIRTRSASEWACILRMAWPR